MPTLNVYLLAHKVGVLTNEANVKSALPTKKGIIYFSCRLSFINRKSRVSGDRSIAVGEASDKRHVMYWRRRWEKPSRVHGTWAMHIHYYSSSSLYMAGFA